MRRAIERFDVLLDAENQMPGHVEHAAHREDRKASERDGVAARDRIYESARLPRRYARLPEHDGGHRREPGVEDRVVRREEALFAEVQVVVGKTSAVRRKARIQRHPTVDEQRGARHVVGRIGAEPHGRLADVFGQPHPAVRD